MTRRPRPARGAALLVAMVLLSVVATLAAGMVWQQWRAVQVETAERSRVQSAWMLVGALDWGRLILREDARSGKPTSLNEPWATPLAEARLSSFLAADRENNADSGPEAFLSGRISDAQARYNLRNLLVDNKVDPLQLAILQRLCTTVGLGPDTASLVADGLLAAQQASADNAPLPPQQLADLAWLGLDATALERLASVVVLLPVATPVNLNTASREVLAGVVSGLDLGSADRLVQARVRTPLRSVADAVAIVGAGPKLQERDVDVKSAYFEVQGRLRLENRVLESRSLVERRSGLQVLAIQRQQQASLNPAAQ
ncbi:type II secretion system minor pseudopilin GspK [Pseudaquabacterium pictum]|uniref:Type II secretion system protein K n=1 Tax=Pseudaquabacterium pictum TaxID=2315236 RepID=A0A480AZL6_9BURK|nr:type II secretion system minor pseudopilin GspK [Rubrivivax pictus]GCL65742.1 type II secretion system protein K [Rubrivivax pictus]